jgi:putative membrane protein
VIAAALVFGVLAVLFHVMAFVFESVLWTRPAVFGRFGVASQADADTTRSMAYNQGFYNLALALGVAVGLVLLTRTGDAFLVGKTLVVFGTSAMTLAGAVLATTGRKYRRSAAIQFSLSAFALVSALLT